MLKGSIDLLDQNELRGWVQDEASPGRTVSLVIYDNDREIGRTRARLFRKDLREAGIGNGLHAFEFKFEVALSPRIKHVIHVRSQDGQDISGLADDAGERRRGALDVHRVVQGSTGARALLNPRVS